MCVCRQVCGTRTVHVPVLRSVHRVRYTDVEGTETRTTGTNTKYQVPGTRVLNTKLHRYQETNLKMVRL